MIIKVAVDIKTPDGICDSFVTYPEKPGSFPGVILYMDAFGPRPYLYEMAEKLASYGYFVLVPNLFYRVRRAPVTDVPFPLDQDGLKKVIPQIMPLARGFSSEQGLNDAQVLLDFLAAQEQVGPGKIGLTGYCMGGSFSIRVAARFAKRIAAVASFHAGQLASDKPDSPHLLLGQITADLYVAHADKDESMPPEQIERFQTALESTKLRYEAEVYRGAAHGFTMKDLPAYNEEALKKHWKKLIELFKRTL